MTSESNEENVYLGRYAEPNGRCIYLGRHADDFYASTWPTMMAFFILFIIYSLVTLNMNLSLPKEFMSSETIYLSIKVIIILAMLTSLVFLIHGKVKYDEKVCKNKDL